MKRVKSTTIMIITMAFALLSSFTAVWADALEDANGYFKFTEVDSTLFKKFGTPRLVEGKDKILCFEYNGYIAGFWDENYREVAKINWKRIGGFYNGIAKVEDENGKAIFIDAKGNIVLKTDYSFDQCGNYCEELIAVVLEPYNEELYWGKCGYIDINGQVKLRLPERFHGCSDFKNGYAVVATVYTGPIPRGDAANGAIYNRFFHFTGFVDKKGTYLGNPTFINKMEYAKDIYFEDNSIGNTDENGAGYWYLADEVTGERSFDAGFYYLHRLSKNLFLYKLNQEDKGGVITAEGKVVMESEHDLRDLGDSTNFKSMSDELPLSQLAFFYSKEKGNGLICLDATGKKMFGNDILVENNGNRTDNYMLVQTYKEIDVVNGLGGYISFDDSKLYIMEVNR